MATNTKYYAVGQGKVYIAPRDASGQIGGFEWIGDADGFTVTGNETKVSFQESYSGNRVKVIDVTSAIDMGFTLNLRNIDGDNLAKAFYGSSAAVAGASVVAEPIVCYNGKMTALKYPGVSAVVVTKTAGSTPLVAGVDYTLDAVNGTLTILSASTVVAAGAGVPCTVNYTQAGVAARVKALTGAAAEYVIRFEGKSQFDNKAQIAMLHRAKPGIAAALSLIGSDVAQLALTGALLPDSSQAVGESQYVTYVQV
jgi:hypothetical protein